MRVYLECVPCFVRQTLEACRMVTQETSQHEKILRQVLSELSHMPYCQSPVHIATGIHELIKQLGGNPDPYKKYKDKFNKFALEIYPRFEKIISCSDDPFQTAIHVAIAGNIIDYGVSFNLTESEVENKIQSLLIKKRGIDKLEELRKAVNSARNILYLGDNAGEIVFDKLLISLLPPGKTTYAVRGKPILNDATLEDAVVTGMVELVPVIDNGSNAPGTIIETCSDKFKQVFDSADLIIAKGQGNYETLSQTNKNIFFLLLAKCPVIASDIGCCVGDIVVAQNLITACG